MSSSAALKAFGMIPYKTISQILFVTSDITHSYKQDADGWMQGRDIKLHKLRYPSQPHITYTMTRPPHAISANTPIVVYAKGNNWDLGWFHRRPYLVSPTNPIHQNKYKGSLAEVMAATTGCTVVCFEYPGYGIEDGQKVSVTQAPEYMKRIILHLRETFPNRPLVMWGYSLGAAVTVRTLELLGEDANHYIAGAVLQSSFVSLRATGGLNPIQQLMMWSMQKDLGLGDYGLLKGARHAKVPLVWMHGSDDILCPIDVVKQKVYSRYPYQKLFLEVVGAAHNNLPLSDYWEKYCKTAIDFILKH